MKTCLLTENFVIYDGGKKVPWDIFWEVIRQLDRHQTIERLQKNKQKFVRFEDQVRAQATEFTEEMNLLGVKPIGKESIEATRGRIMRRIQSLNKGNVSGE